MVYIKKLEPSVRISENIRQVKSSVDNSTGKSTQTQIMRSAFDQLDKHEIKSQLIKEQKGICAYCMRRIHNDEHTSIEHLRSIDAFPDEALSYNNMMACCDGGRSQSIKPHVLCCDAAKGNNQITISPYDPDHISKIRYDRTGRIYIFPEDQVLSKDINQTLRLNGDLDENNELINDTATRLVYGRRQTYKAYELFIKALSRRNKNIRAALQRKEREILNAEEYPEYAGVWLYFIRRKLRSA